MLEQRRKLRARIEHLPSALVALIALWLSASAPAAEAAWRRAESEHLIVYGNTDEARLREFTRRLERFHALLTLMIPGPELDAMPKLPVYLVSDRSDMRRALPSTPDDLAGLYTASADGIRAIAIARRPGNREGDDTLLHEYTHHYMMQRARGSYPTWFVEGFAEYYSTADVSTERVTVGKPNEQQRNTLSYLPWISFDDVFTGSPWRMNSRQRASFYAQSWLLTHYLLRDSARWTSAQAYFRSLRAGMPAKLAFEKHFATSFQTLRSDLIRYGERSMQYSVLNATLPEPQISITSMPASADALMLPAIAVLHEIADDDALAALRDGPRRFPGDAFSIEMAARAEILADNPQLALDLLKPLLGEQATADQVHIAARATLALAHAKAEAKGASIDAGEDEFVAAANLFVRTLKLDPQHFTAMYRYWQIRARENGPPNTRLQDVLVQAYNLAPQAKEIAVNTGFMLLGVARAKEARVVLEALAGDPHGQEAGAVARRLVELIDAQPAGESPSPEEIAAALAAPVLPMPTLPEEEQQGERVQPEPNEA